ncbi:alpha/beta-hydrolase [Xylariaceae sp. AK1471]|nr:alpha/beta-hydrolase [Xylariaceae sp. AK1471]
MSHQNPTAAVPAAAPAVVPAATPAPAPAADGTQIFALRDGRKISYKLDPPTFLRDLSRPAILLASPMGFPLGAWDRFTYLLYQAGFRVVRYDPPGVGNSDAPPDPMQTTFKSLADDAARLLFHLGQLRLAMWIGVELGAATGLNFASRYPILVQNLICSSTPLRELDPCYTSFYQHWVNLSKTTGSVSGVVEMIITTAVGTHRIINPQPDVVAQIQRLRKLIHANVKPAGLECGYAAYANLKDTGYGSNHEQLVPKCLDRAVQYIERVTLVAGEHEVDVVRNDMAAAAPIDDQRRWWCVQGHKGPNPSDLVKPDYSKPRLANPQGLVLIPEGGHVPFLDGQQGFLRLVLDILKPVPKTWKQRLLCPECGYRY